MSPTDLALYIDPFTKQFQQDRLFDPNGIKGAGHNALAPFVHLREWLQARGVEVHTADALDAKAVNSGATNVYISLGVRDRYARLARRPDVVLSGFFAFECPVVLPALYGGLHEIGTAFRRVFSFSTTEALRPFLKGPVELERFMLPQSFDDVHREIWENRDRRFLVIINANKLTAVRVNELYSERLRALEFFHRYGEVDLYGLGWDQPPLRLGRGIPRVVQRAERRVGAVWRSVRGTRDPVWAAVEHAYRGPTDHKDRVLGSYTFSICFENSVLEGWITEKIFDCFYAGTVPIYWGAPDVDRWIPPECFIDMRQFDGYTELREFLHALSPDEIQAYRVAARDFLRSERFRPFAKQTFAELVGGLVAADTGVTL